MNQPNQIPQSFNLAILEVADLLPKKFREQRQVYRTLYVWSALTLASGAVLAGTVAAFWAQAKQSESDRTRLIADAAPLKDVRGDVVRLQRQIEALRTTCTLVESAKPSDELLQSLAAVTFISHDDEHDVIVESINVRLALEYPQTEDARPKWAESELSVTITVPDHDATKQWLQRLDESDRIENPVVTETEQTAEFSRTNVTAKPLAITDLP